MSFPTDIITGLSMTQAQPVPDQRDLTDINSNVVQGARYINPLTGDYSVYPNGHFQGMNDIQQKVMLALLTTFGTASSPIGQTFSEIKLITANVQQQVQSSVQTALASLLNGGYIILTDPPVIKIGQYGRIYLTVYWKNISTGQVSQSNLPVAGI